MPWLIISPFFAFLIEQCVGGILKIQFWLEKEVCSSEENLAI